MNIGVIDSGVGGLTILYDLINKYPHNNYYYLGDSKNCPYGTKEDDIIKKLSKKLVNYLITNYEIDILIIACNTISSVALDYLKDTFKSLKIIGMIKPTALYALSKTINNKVGLIATPATINSKKYNEILGDKGIYYKACPEFVNMVEKVKLNIIDAYKINKIMKNISDKNIDTLILGCTHYPLLIDKFKIKYKGNIITSNEAIIKELENILKNKKENCEIKILTTIDNILFEKQIKQIFKKDEKVDKVTL